MKFTMPPDPSDQIRMHEAMLSRVEEARKHVAGQMDRIAQELDRQTAAGEDVREIHQARKKLHLQELCLIDQERRLKERITSLRISGSTDGCRAGA